MDKRLENNRIRIFISIHFYLEYLYDFYFPHLYFRLSLRHYYSRLKQGEPFLLSRFIAISISLEVLNIISHDDSRSIFLFQCCRLFWRYIKMWHLFDSKWSNDVNEWFLWSVINCSLLLRLAEHLKRFINHQKIFSVCIICSGISLTWLYEYWNCWRIW